MSYQPAYGFPCVTDPRDFDPDVECCSPEEIAAHRLACQTYGKTEYQPNKGCYTEVSDDGQIVKHVTRTSWGIGVNLILSCDDCGQPVFDSGVHCHECERDYCEVCWPKHDAQDECK